MADIFDTATRSRVMSRIRSKDTKPEVMVRKFLFSKGLRYRKNMKGLPGKPDIVSRKYGSVVFVNGCFWHGHENCRHFSLPKTRVEFWKSKIERNIARDGANTERLVSMGWKVFVVWECQLKGKPESFLETLHSEIISHRFN